MSDVKALGDDILSRYNNDNWDAEHVVITDLVRAKTATILISNSQNAHIDLALQGQIGAATARLADATANVSVTRASGIGTRVVAAKGLTPLFKVAGIRRRWFRNEDFARRGPDEVQFVELGYKDFV